MLPYSKAIEILMSVSMFSKANKLFCHLATMVLILLAIATDRGVYANEKGVTAEQMQNWRDATFGMFIHWGAYSYLAGAWQGEPVDGYAEHILRKEKIPLAEYKAEVVGKFNPQDFDADEWVRIAKSAGMKYIVISTNDRPEYFQRTEKQYWEAIPTTNDSYGYHAYDKSHKPVSVFVDLLVRSAARGGNLLMNVGPMGNGEIDPVDVKLLARIGKPAVTWST